MQNTCFTSQGRDITWTEFGTSGLTRTQGVDVDHGSDFTIKMWYDKDT
jgi:hypothetical protein